MIRKLKHTDLPGLNSLPPLDWDFKYEDFLREYDREDYFSAFVTVLDEKVIGTGNVFLKEKVGWLANIIVSEKHRGKGLGYEMSKFLVEYLESNGCETQLLIATELGASVYRKIGFSKMTDYLCFDSEVDRDIKVSDHIRELEHTDLIALYQLDREANGEDRTHYIEKYYRNGLGYFNSSAELLGFYLPSFSRGLVLSRDEAAGLELLKVKHSKKGVRTMLPVENKVGIDFLKQGGLKEGQKLSRMIYGKENNWNPKYIYSYGSGYCG